MQLRRWLRQRKEIKRRANIQLVIKDDVEYSVNTLDAGEGLYQSTIQCNCGRLHIIVHYTPRFGAYQVEAE